MNALRLARGFALVAILGVAPVDAAHAQESPAVDLADLQGWRDALGSRANVTMKGYPALNHLFLPGEGKSTPSEYDRAGHIPAFVLDDIAGWIRKVVNALGS